MKTRAASLAERFPWVAEEIRDDCQVLCDCFAALGAKDAQGAIARFHEDGEYRSAFAPAEGTGVYRGTAGLLKYFDTVFELFDRWEITPTNFVASDDRILVLCHFLVSGHGSGMEMAQPIGTIWMLRDGLIARGFGYLDVASAIDGMAQQCGRDRAEIEVRVAASERAREEYGAKAPGHGATS